MLPRFLAFAVAFVLAPVLAAAGDAPARVVSINLCGDELLLTLADPSQIAALSVYAADPVMSFTAGAATAHRHDISEAEQVVDLDADLVLAGRYTKRATREMLERLGYRVELLDSPDSIDASIEQIRRVAALLGHPERGEALVADIAAARARALDAAPQGGDRPTAAVYQRRGYVSGGDTLTTELLGIAGFDTAGLVGDRGGFVPLEKLLAAPPDFIVVARASVRPEDQGSALLSHPALAELFPPERRIVMPENLTVCGGPSLPAALDRVSAEAARVRPQS